MKQKNFLLAVIFLLLVSACGENSENDSQNLNEGGGIEIVSTEVPTEVVPPTPTVVPLVDPAGNEGLRHFVLLSPDTTVSYSVDEIFFGQALSKINREEGDNTAVGVSSGIEGEFYIGTNWSATEIGTSLIRVDMTSLVSDSTMRDDWLEAQRFNTVLPSNRYSQMVIVEIENFPAEVVEGELFSFQLIGDLTILKTTLPVTLDVTAELNGNLLFGQAETFLFMADFGIDPPDILNVLKVVDGVTLTIEFTAEER